MTARALGMVLAAFGCAPPVLKTATPAASSAAITEADLSLHVHALAHDSMQGREAGTIGSARATAYIARELARLGARPAGEAGTFLQTVPLVLRRPDAASVLRFLADSVRFGRDLLPLRSVGGAPFGRGFDASNVEVVFGGHVGETLIEPDSARGRIVVFGPRRTGGPATQPVSGLPNAALATYRGVAGMLFAGLEALPTALVAFLEQPVMMRPGGTPAPDAIPAARISTVAAERLMGASLASTAIGARGARVSGVFGFADSAPAHASQNVIAIIPGRDRALAGSFVAVGSHSDHIGMAPVALDHDSVLAFNRVLRRAGANEPSRVPNIDQLARIREIRDSLGGIRPSRRDSVFNGADDDASAVAVAIELVEHFKAFPPRRSILFVFHTAEEKGLFGADYFTEHPTVARDSIVAQVNLDQVSRGGPEDIAGARPRTLYILGSRRLSSALGDLVEDVNKLPGNGFTLDYSLDTPGHPANGYCRSDHYMYARYGIPIVFLTAGWHPDYHMVTDEAGYARTDVMRGVAGFVRDIVTSVADGPRPVRDRPLPDPRAPCRQ